MVNPYKPTISNSAIRDVVKVLKSGKWAQGEKVEEFEKAFARYIGTKYAVAVGNGTEALHIALLALEIKKGDEVITTDFSFIATVNCIKYVGATPVLVGVGEDFCIDPGEVEKILTNKTRAIIPVHLYGQPADMGRIMQIAKKHHLYVIEDACQAHGATYKGRKLGSIGNVGCFSFYPTKNLSSIEGGMLTTNSPKINRELRLLRNHGQKERYKYTKLGYNFRMNEVSATIGLHQLKALDKLNHTRIKNAKYLSKHLPADICPREFPDRKHVFNQYTIKVKNRDKVRKYLGDCGIQSEVYYPPNKEVLSIPVHPRLKKDDLIYIVEKIKECL